MATGDEPFFKRVEGALRDLFDKARSTNELHFALGLFEEFRGLQGPGWSPAQESERAFKEYLALLEQMPEGAMRVRIALSFYTNLAEASGRYEVPKNMLRILSGESHSLTPFSSLVRNHRLTGEKIAPNANKVLQDLIGHAAELGLDDLAAVLRDAFDPDIRNGYAHADYVVWEDGLRLPRKNGGGGRIVSWKEFDAAFQRGVGLFAVLGDLVKEQMLLYESPKIVAGRLGPNDQLLKWTISCDKARGSFRLSSTGEPA